MLILKVNAACEVILGVGFFLIPDTIIPHLNQNGRTTTRVFGTSLISLGCISWKFATSRDAILCNLIFHIFGGLVLAFDAVTGDESPFIPPTMLHLVLTIGLLKALMQPHQLTVGLNKVNANT